jgi:hypothetical protein
MSKDAVISLLLDEPCSHHEDLYKEGSVTVLACLGHHGMEVQVVVPVYI